MKTNFKTYNNRWNRLFKSFLNKAINEFQYNEIRIFSRDEKTRGFKKKIKNSKVKFYIGDVRDYRSVSEAVKGVDYIFHAAALKQVPLVNSFLLRLLN